VPRPAPGHCIAEIEGRTTRGATAGGRRVLRARRGRVATAPGRPGRPAAGQPRNRRRPPPRPAAP